MTPRRTLALFVALAYGISWAIWAPLAGAAISGGTLSPGWTWLHPLGGLGPLVAAFLVAWAKGRMPAVYRLARRCVMWRVAPSWHLLAWLGPVVLYGIGVIIARGAGQEVPLAAFGSSEEFPALPRVAYWTMLLVAYGWGEEVGWRGIVLPMLQRRGTALAATLGLTIIWAGWHLPLFLFVDGYTSMGAGDIAGWMVSLVAGAILLTWFFNGSGGSLLIVAAFHASMDVAFNSPGPPLLYAVIGASLMFGAVLVLWRAGPKNLSLRSRVQALPWDTPYLSPEASGGVV